MRHYTFAFAVLMALALLPWRSSACTGISLTASDGSHIVARTLEWAASPTTCGYMIVPRGHQHHSLTPAGANGLTFIGRYGYTAIWTDYEEVVVEGMNETGLNAGLFFFPNYSEYPSYNPDNSGHTLSDMQFVSWVLANFSTIDEVQEAIKSIDVVGLDSRIGTVHWRISEPGGRVVVLEYVNGEPHFYENPLGVLTNAPGFEWQMLNLNNYINLFPGSAPDHTIAKDVSLKPFGGNSGMLGLPGDFTPPSRFVRAAIYQTTAPTWATAFETVREAFHILNNFDIPVGIQRNITPDKSVAEYNPANMPSATQFTAVSDQANRKFYFTTCWNTTIRCIDLKAVDFSKAKYEAAKIDTQREQPIETIIG